MIIAIDFDGTCVTHAYPVVGHEIGASYVLRKLIKNGHQLILWTMRSDDRLQDAVDWFKKNRIKLYGINSNPTQNAWTNSPKAYAQLYIDDAALGCPLHLSKLSERPYADWIEILKVLKTNEIITK